MSFNKQICQIIAAIEKNTIANLFISFIEVIYSDLNLLPQLLL